MARILFVTGKGGSGKTTLARALAAEARRRRMAALRLRFPASAEESLADVEPDEQVLDGRGDLEAFLTRVLGFGFLARRLQSSTTFSAVAAAAPGLRDLVALTTAAALAKRRRGIVVVDAPSSGHSVALLASPARVLEMATVGPIAREASQAKALLGNPRAFGVLVLATPEELSVTEARALRSDVTAAGVASARIVLNGCWPELVAPGPDADRIAAASPDAELYLRRQQRQAAVAASVLDEPDGTPRIGFDFETGAAPAGDVAALFDRLEQDAA